MNRFSSHVQDKNSAIALHEQQQSYYRRLFRIRSVRKWALLTLLLLLGTALCIVLVVLAHLSTIGVCAGITITIVLAIGVRYELATLLLLTLGTTDFIPEVLSIKTLKIYPIILYIPFTLLILAIKLALRSKIYTLPSLRHIWPMLTMVMLAIISNVAIHITWTPGVEHQEHGNPLFFSELVGILMYLLPLLFVTLMIALLTHRSDWTRHIVNLLHAQALLAALLVLIDCLRLHSSVYTYRFVEPSIAWIRLQDLAMPLALGCLLGYASALHATHWHTRLLWLVEVLLCTAALFITLQNSWWIEALIGIIVITAFSSLRLLVAIMLCGLALLFTVQHELVTLLSVKSSDALRLIIWQDILRIWQLHPLLGVGPGNVWTYDQHFTHLPLFLRDFTTTGLGVAHNGYLQVLAELGPIGLLCLLAMLIILGHVSWRLYRRSHPSTAQHDYILALVSLGLLAGSAVADITSGAFFYLNSQIGGFNAIPTLLANWVVFALVLHKELQPPTTSVQRKNRNTYNSIYRYKDALVTRFQHWHKYIHKQPLPLSEQFNADHSSERMSPIRQWTPGTSGFDEYDSFVIPEHTHHPPEQQVPSTHLNMQHDIQSAASNIALVGAGNIAGSLLKYGCNFLLQIGFGAATYGLYSVALSLILLVAAICDLGLDTAATRYVAIYHAQQKMQLLRGFAIFSSCVSGIAGLVSALLLLWLAPTLAAWMQEPQATLLLQCMAPMVPLLCMQTLWLSCLQGLHAFAERVIAERILTPLLLLSLLLFAAIYLRTPQGIALASMLSVAGGAITTLYYLRQRFHHVTYHDTIQYHTHSWMQFAALNFITTLTEELLEAIDLLLLALFAVASMQIGEYSAAVKISNFIAMPLFSLNTIFAPSIASLYSKGELQRLATLFQVTTRWTIMCSLPIYCIATLFSQPLLSLSRGSFAQAWPLLVMTAIGTMINAGTGSVGYMLLMTNHQRLSLCNSLLALLFNIVGGVLLIPSYGAMGMALTTTSVLLLVNILRVIQVYLLFGIFPYNQNTLKPLIAGCGSALITGAAFLLLRNTPTWIQLLLIAVFLLCYVGLLLLLKGSPEDTYLMTMLRNKFTRSTI